MWRSFLTTAVFLPISLIGPKSDADEIPQRYRGAYTSNIAESGRCERSKIVAHEDDGGMVIGAKNIIWWESGCDVLAVGKSSDRLNITYRMVCGGEGESWKSDITLSGLTFRSRPAIAVADRNVRSGKTTVTVYERCD
jgi:hypothetical protein